MDCYKNTAHNRRNRGNMAQKLEGKTLAGKYYNFHDPVVQVWIGGREVRLQEGLYLERVEVISGVGMDPDMAALTYRADRISKTCISALEKVLYVGEKVEVKAGYGGSVARIFLGYLQEAEVASFQKQYVEYTLICLDVKGLMKKNSSFEASGARKAQQILNDILNTSSYGFLVEKKNVDSLPKDFNQDCVIRGSTHYDWMCSLAEYLDYEFFCGNGVLSFQKARKDTQVMLELTGQYGLQSVRTIVSMAGQVGSVHINGCNRKDEKLSGSDKWKAPSGPFLGRMKQKLQGYSKVIWDMELETAAQAASCAQAIMNRISRQAVRMQARHIGIPEFTPGVCVEIKVEDMPSLSGTIYVEEVRHLLDSEGYHAEITGSSI